MRVAFRNPIKIGLLTVHEFFSYTRDDWYRITRVSPLIWYYTLRGAMMSVALHTRDVLNARDKMNENARVNVDVFINGAGEGGIAQRSRIDS